MRLDTRRQRETPEGVTLSFPVAGPSVRLMAWLLDAVLILLVMTVVSTFLGMMGELGMGLYLIVLFLLWWFYPVAFEVWRDGMTPGKKRLGLQVIHDDGTPVGWTASLLRNLLRSADFLPFAHLAGLMSMLLDRDFRRLGDLAAGTLVVHRERAPQGGQVSRQDPVAPPVALLQEERRALIDFASRLPRWNYERAKELARVAYPLTRAPGEKGLERLVGMANWVLGRRVSAAEAEPAGGGTRR